MKRGNYSKGRMAWKKVNQPETYRRIMRARRKSFKHQSRGKIIALKN